MSSYTPLGEALDEYMKVLLDCGMKPQSEIVAVCDSAGRITAEPVYAAICAPHYNACAMDGIATLASYTVGASEESPVVLSPEQFVRVDTGDLLPDGFDCVVMVEDVVFADGTGDSSSETGQGDGSPVLRSTTDRENRPRCPVSCTITATSTPWKHVRVIGEDICAGEMILPSNTEIIPSALGAMIASGVLEVQVIKKPVVGFIPTGDEIITPVANPKPGEILEFNSAIVSAMLKKWGAVSKVYPIVKDNKELIIKALKKALGECDIILLSAGASKGREDFSAAAISDVAKILVQGIAMRPGKPTILGYDGAKPVIGMPGYPVSGIIVMEQILQPLVSFLSCATRVPDKYIDAVLSRPVKSTAGFFEFTRVKLGFVKNVVIASPISGGSGVVTSFMRADGILEVPQDVTEYKTSDKVRVRLLRREDEIKRSIVAIGSHDQLLDEIGDLLQSGQGDGSPVLRYTADRENRPRSPFSLTSTNVGSMQGIYAIRKGEAHIAGVHLLDEKTGEYNKSFVNRLIPEGGVTLYKCVKRKQGLLLAKGNPKGITGIGDLLNGGIRYVNRQKGSGTRILFDYLCRRDGIDAAAVYGYDREVYTHMSVAALVAAGMADAGIGTYSAAKMYDLDFLHISDEVYDLLIPDHFLELPSIQALLGVISSKEFKNRLEKLGGYIVF